MRQGIIVIGCSYGDEGKGLVTSWSAKQMPEPRLNVLVNGGAQRGHTVDFPDGRRHVFHHFGAASLQEDTLSCADEDYIVNPLLFMQEREELERDFRICPRLTISDRCRVSTPWDMMLGQMIEENRGSRRHGSCGCGIQETRLRYMHTDWAMRWGELKEISKDRFLQYSHRITEEYLPARLAELNMTAGEMWQKTLKEEAVFEAAWLDLSDMADRTESYHDWKTLADPFPSLLFEAGQGLALDAENREDFPYLTPSHTTSLISARRIAMLSGKTKTVIRYVTRSYLTRHGAGPLPTECAREEINPSIVDRTNMPNPHQQELRYGLFDGPAILKRVQGDLTNTQPVVPDAVPEAVVTHLNETNGELKGNITLSAFASRFGKVWLSDCPWSIRN